jgi:orotidine-5'-phosphate decarboxylase
MSKKAQQSPQLIVALDNGDVDHARALVDELSKVGVKWFKVGLELYTQSGPAFVAELKQRGLQVFLDLKLYDIPNTVAKAVEAAAKTGADLLTVHCSGGPAMLSAAQEAAEAGSKSSKLSLLGVTVLTSFGDDAFSEVARAWGASSNHQPTRASVASKLAAMAAQCGLPGIVCSVADLTDNEFQKLSWRESPLFVTPGIRNEGDAAGDQKSIATAPQAVRAGSTHLVVGRPITGLAPGARGQAASVFLKQLQVNAGAV